MSHDADLDPAFEAKVIAETRAWLEHVVIGLNLCPFAKAVAAKGQVRYTAPAASDTAACARACARSCRCSRREPAEIDTTLLICPRALPDFEDYNDFLDEATPCCRRWTSTDVIQVASFHPDYRFADTEADDVTNATSRSPCRCCICCARTASSAPSLPSPIPTRSSRQPAHIAHARREARGAAPPLIERSR
jgi:hypothetical protein